MKVYIVEQEDAGTSTIIGVYAQKQDAIDMCLASFLNIDDSLSIHEVIE